MRVRASRSGDAGTRGSVREGETLTARERARRRTRANVFENVSARRALTQRARRRPLATAARGRRPRVTPDDADGFADDARRCGGERFARSRGVRARVERARGWREAFGGKRTRGANGRGDGAEPARGEGRLARHLRGLRAERPPRQPRRVQPRRRRRRERRARRRRRSDPPRARTHRGLRPRGFAPSSHLRAARRTPRPRHPGVAHRIRPRRSVVFEGARSRDVSPRDVRRGASPAASASSAVALFARTRRPFRDAPPSTRVVEPTRPRNPAPRSKPAAKRRKIKSRRKPGTESKAKASSAKAAEGQGDGTSAPASAIVSSLALADPASPPTRGDVPLVPGAEILREPDPAETREGDGAGSVDPVDDGRDWTVAGAGDAGAREESSRSRRDAESRRRARGHRRADVRERAHVFVRAVRAVGD